MSVKIVELVGTPQLKQFHMVNTKMFRHPKYYKELRKLRNNSDQAISNSYVIKDSSDKLERAPWSGPKASSFKQQAPSVKPQAPEASSGKRQALRCKRQA